MARNNAKIPGRASSDNNLSSTDFRVLIAICRCIDMKTNGNHIKRETLSALSGEKDFRHLTRTTNRLVKFGYIQKSGNGGRSRPSYYRVFMDGERVVSDGIVCTPQRVPNPATKGCQIAAQRVVSDGRGKDRDVNTEKKKGKNPPLNGSQNQPQRQNKPHRFDFKGAYEAIRKKQSAEQETPTPLSKKTH